MGGDTSAHSHLMPRYQVQSDLHGEVASLDRARQAGDALVEDRPPRPQADRPPGSRVCLPLEHPTSAGSWPLNDSQPMPSLIPPAKLLSRRCALPRCHYYR